MAAALALAGLAVTLAQPSRDGVDQGLHLFDLPSFKPRQRRVAQDLVAQVFAFLAAVEHQRLRDDFADVFAQRRQCRGEPFGFRRIGRCQRVEIVAQPLDAEQVENPGREDAALGKITDVGQ